MDREQRLAWRRKHYRAKWNRKGYTDWQHRLANHRDYDRQRYAAITIEQHCNSSQRRREQRIRADDSHQQQHPNNSNHNAVWDKSLPCDHNVTDQQTLSLPFDHDDTSYPVTILWSLHNRSSKPLATIIVWSMLTSHIWYFFWTTIISIRLYVRSCFIMTTIAPANWLQKYHKLQSFKWTLLHQLQMYQYSLIFFSNATITLYTFSVTTPQTVIFQMNSVTSAANVPIQFDLLL